MRPPYLARISAISPPYLPTATLAFTLAPTLARTLARTRCVFATPTEHSGGPTIDTGPDGRSPGTLAKLRCAGLP